MNLQGLIKKHKLVEGDKVVCVTVDPHNFSNGTHYTLSKQHSGTLMIKSKGLYWVGDSAKFRAVVKPISYPNPPHKHAELIKAWADGAQIQLSQSHGEPWRDLLRPDWSAKTYRIKPAKSAKDIKLEELEASMRKLADEIKGLQDD
tara:strand:+ start:264 stop:701 length:438 start_codon:yes stop_codon:yes gene_type:complete